jgi:hypothetical protein
LHGITLRMGRAPLNLAWGAVLMASMPRGEPRSVPDPDGDLYDEMIRQENAKKARDVALRLPGVGAALPFLHPDFSKSSRSPFVTVDGRRIDTRCVLGGKAPPSAVELANQREVLNRAFYQASSPLAGAAYGIAAMAGASAKIRDRAMVAGGALEAVMMAASPRGAVIRRPKPPSAQPIAERFVRDPVRRGTANGLGQVTHVEATLTAPMLGTGTKPDRRIKPPGWRGDGRTFNESRGHLLANALGGTGKYAWNLVTQTQQGSNTPQMRSFEQAVAARVRSGEAVEYGARPLYRDGILPPSAILLTATGIRKAPTARLIANPAGRPR